MKTHDITINIIIIISSQIKSILIVQTLNYLFKKHIILFNFEYISYN